MIILLLIYTLGVGAFGTILFLFRDRRDSALESLSNVVFVMIWPVVLIAVMMKEARGR